MWAIFQKKIIRSKQIFSTAGHYVSELTHRQKFLRSVIIKISREGERCVFGLNVGIYYEIRRERESRRNGNSSEFRC